MVPNGRRPSSGDVDVGPLDSSRALVFLKELGVEVTEDSLALMPALLSFVKHDVHVVVRQSIAAGTSLFRVVLEKMALQLHKSGKVERWLEEMWDWMVKFKDAMYDILKAEPGPVGVKMLAVKFLEVYVMLLTADSNSIMLPCTEGKEKKITLSCFTEGNPLNPSLLASEANRAVAFLSDMLQSAIILRGSLTIVVIDCLTAIARNRPVHYTRILSVLLDFDSNLEILKQSHAASLRYCMRSSLLRFLQCRHPLIIESRDKLLKALRIISPGEATERIIRQLEKMSKDAGYSSSQDVRLSKDDSHTAQLKYVVPDAMPAKRTRFAMDAMPSPAPETCSDFGQEEDELVNGFCSSLSMTGGNSNLTEVEKTMATIGALMAEGERATESLDFLISNIHADLMADIVIDNMKHLPKSQLPILYSSQDVCAASNNNMETSRGGSSFSSRGSNNLTG